MALVRTGSISQFRDGSVMREIRKLNRNDLIIFLIPVVVFSIYLIVFNPCVATLDSFNQLHQIASGQFTNWHPFFHTFIEMMCLRVYPSTISICILQILVFSLMWTAVCKYCRDDDSKGKVFRWQAIVSVLICIIPINGLYAVTLWKDILFSYFLMFSCFLIKVMVDRGGDVDYRFIFLLSVVMAFVAQLRGNGMYVVLICLAVYFVYLFLKRNVKMGVLLVILTVTLILLISSLNVAYEVKDNEKDAFMTKLAHMLADYDMNLDMEASDRDKVHEIIDKDRVADRYMRTGTDSTLAILNIKNYEKDRQAYIEIALKYSLRNPLHCLEYLFSSSPMVWDIIKDPGWAGRPYYMNGEEDRLQMDFNYYYGPHNYTPHEPYENLSYANWGTPAFDALNLLSMGIEASIFDTVFNSPAMYMYISIAILIWIHLATGYREIYLMYVPNLLNIVIVFFSTPIQDYRYLYANLLVCYLLIIILIGLRGHCSDKPKVSSDDI